MIAALVLGSVRAELDARFLAASVDGTAVRVFLDTGAYRTVARAELRGRTLAVLGGAFSLRTAGEMPPRNPQRADVYLGLDYVRTRPIAFDPRTGFSRGRPLAFGGVPIRRRLNDHLTVPATFDAVPTEALFDTGADVSVVDADLGGALPESWRRGETERVQTFYGDLDARRIAVPVVRVGGFDVGRNVSLYALSLSFLSSDGPSGVTAILGWDVLRRNRWKLDASSNRLAFEDTPRRSGG